MQYSFTDKEKLFLDIFGESNKTDYISFGGIVMDQRATTLEETAEMEQIFSGILEHARRDETDRLKHSFCR